MECHGQFHAVTTTTMLAHYRTRLGFTTQRQLPPTPWGNGQLKVSTQLAGGRIEERWLGCLNRACDECHGVRFENPSLEKYLTLDFCLGKVKTCKFQFPLCRAVSLFVF